MERTGKQVLRYIYLPYPFVFIPDCSLLSPVSVSIIPSFPALSFFPPRVHACRFPIALFYALSISLFLFIYYCDNPSGVRFEVPGRPYRNLLFRGNPCTRSDISEGRRGLRAVQLQASDALPGKNVLVVPADRSPVKCE